MRWAMFWWGRVARGPELSTECRECAHARSLSRAQVTGRWDRGCTLAHQSRPEVVCGVYADLFIDARHKGNLARLLNSSCDPNCETQKWHDAGTGEVRVGIFAKRDIFPGEELTYGGLQGGPRGARGLVACKGFRRFACCTCCACLLCGMETALQVEHL